MSPETERFVVSHELFSCMGRAYERLQEDGEATWARNQVLALLFLKRLNDLFEEQYRTLYQHEITAGHSEERARRVAEDPDEHRFFIPAEARWAVLEKAGEDLYQTLVSAFAALERANAQLLGGLFSTVRFGDQHSVAGRSRLNARLREILGDCEELALGNQALLTPGEPGQASEQFIEYLAEFTSKRGENVASPAPLRRILVELLRPQENMRICDPTCGTGGLLVACAQYVEAHGGNSRNLSLFGHERDPETWTACKLNLLLHDLPDNHVVNRSVIGAPLLGEDRQLMKFDLVVAEPPFAPGDWDMQEAQSDPWGRFAAGLPPRTRGVFAYVQHIAATLNDNGRAAVVVPHGLLFRSGIEREMRAALLRPEVDLIEAIISLPAGLLYATNARCAVMVLNRNKPVARRGKVLFIDATGFSTAGAEPVLQDADIIRIVALFRSLGESATLAKHTGDLIGEWRNTATNMHTSLVNRIDHHPGGAKLLESRWREQLAAIDSAAEVVRRWLQDQPLLQRFTAVATLLEIAETHNYNLNPARYLATAMPVTELDVEAELVTLSALEAQKAEAEKEMNRLLVELGYAP